MKAGKGWGSGPGSLEGLERQGSQGPRQGLGMALGGVGEGAGGDVFRGA